MRKETKVALIAVTAGAVVAGVGITAYALVGGGSDSAGEEPLSPKELQAKPLTKAEVERTTEKFLAAWAKGDAAGAAALTDDAAAAKAALVSYQKDAHLTGVTFTPGKKTGAKVPFKVAATVSYEGKSKPYTYDSELTVVRALGGKPVVDWQPSVVHPGLKPGDVLRAGEAGTPPIKAVDRNGGEITAEKYPSLGNVLDGLREKFGKKAGGSAGIELQIVRADPAKDKAKGKSDTAKSKDDGKALPDKTLLTLSQGTPGTVKTTISPTAQAAAEREVASRSRAAIVVLKPSTGEILAAANSNPSGMNVALQGSLAPGSTMKIVTASMLLEKGLAGIDKPHPCPKYFTSGGWKFQNVEEFEIKGGTFRSSFAASCNTAFISQADKLGDGDLTKQAQEVFGLGRGNWQIGVPSFDGAVPVQSAAQKAAALIGQGGVRMNPLNVASIIATAKTGVFRQPYLVSPEVDGRQLATAPRTLDPKAASQLRELLAYTATNGSAAEAMASLGGDIGGKTGSAEVDGQEKPNGWFTAWRGDVAAAAVMQEGGRGGKSSGPLVAAVLRQVG
ncbi:penicillin-binding protein [Streptomyces sp. TRM66268-LWL]|uniref:Penicillin-binding protein n=1 Tax=Streptomyces polyasparticus TaxID=2767826 RepID=A0ABR7SMV5_9ACTN|nr:penicillin-binding transpeptidase domain-containing protein [Streptomyces polyasparticus]MBC9716821.1 penicillin-binding protein [Streptomyces polyasparticus]